MSTPQPPFDFTALSQSATHLTHQFLEQLGPHGKSLQPIVESFQKFTQSLLQDPERLMQRQLDLYQAQLALWANMAEKAMGKPVAPIATPEKGDRRFANAAWEDNFVFDFVKQSYLLLAKWLLDSVADAQGVDEPTRKKMRFYTQQYLDALSPTNFPFTNPDVLAQAIETNGQSLLNGLQNLLQDMQAGKIAMTDYNAFAVGKNLAITPGKVVYRNKLFELIQYTPTTPHVHARPLLISPPWINRFYILDLQPANSFVKYAVEQGFQVFLISWKNPDASYRDVTFEDYMSQGLLEAIDETRAITGSPDVNAIGYCIGGTLLAATLAALKAKQDARVHSATFFTTLMDFAGAGELDVFLDEPQVAAIEAGMQEKGFLDGKEMAATFSLLRANDLIWSFVVNNYLLGKQPFPFDILYWNDDPTRMPCAMHSWYLRNLYLENNLVQPNKLELLGVKIDLSRIDLPIYMVSAIADHITPWESCYQSLPTLRSKDVVFTLSKAGHVAGVVNPPTPAGKEVKRAFWSGPVTVANPQEWLKQQQQQADSWWPHWADWLRQKSGPQQAAPKTMGSKQHPILADAPGTYVNERD